MTEADAEFQTVDRLQAEALGEPGHRTFRILVDSTQGSAMLWLEKEQLFQLGMAIGQLLVSVPEGATPEAPGQEPRPLEPFDVEFKVGRLLLGHDGARGQFLIEAHDTKADEDSAPAVRIWGDRPQLKALADEAFAACAAGRPLCLLCGGPMDPNGHRCPRVNGHGVHDLADI